MYLKTELADILHDRATTRFMFMKKNFTLDRSLASLSTYDVELVPLGSKLVKSILQTSNHKLEDTK